MTFDNESKSRDKTTTFLLLFRGRGLILEKGVQLSCGHVDIVNRMILHDDNSNQGFFCGGGGVEAGHVYKARRGAGRKFRAIILISDTLYHHCSIKSV